MAPSAFVVVTVPELCIQEDDVALLSQVNWTFSFYGEPTVLGASTVSYDAVQGVRISRDPLDNAEMLQWPNLYAYVSNNPINATDPLGLQEGPIPNAPINTPQGQIGLARATEFAEKGFEVLNKTVSTPVKDAMTKGNIEAICQAERDAAARGYQAAMEKIKDAGARAYNQARIDYAKNGGKPFGTMLEWLRNNGFVK